MRKAIITCMVISLISAALLSCGMKFRQPPESCKRIAIHTVKTGDTLRAISFKYLDLNTYDKKYVLAFEQDIKDLNPEVIAGNRYLQPGDKIQIVYWVRE